MGSHPQAVQDGLKRAGLSANSELEPDCLERARQVGEGEVEFSTESARRAYIMSGSNQGNKEEATMAATATRTRSSAGRRRGPDPKSNRQRILRSALKAIQASDEGKLSRKEIDAKVRVTRTSKSTPADWVMDAARTEYPVEGFKFVKVGRGEYAVEKLEG